MSQKLKQAKELYKAEKFDECYKLTEGLLATSKDYETLVIHGACCSQLGNEKEAIDSFFLAISLDSVNLLAWIGLYNETKKSLDKNHKILLRVCTVLIEKCSKSGSIEKYLEYAKMLVQVVVQFRLPLPLGFDGFSDVCEFVLEHDENNVYAIEATFRLQIEYFLFYGFPEFIDQSLSSISSKFENLTIHHSGVHWLNSSTVYSQRLEQFERLLQTLREQQTTYLTKTAQITLCLGQCLQSLYTVFIPNFAPPNHIVDDSDDGVTTNCSIQQNTEEHLDLWHRIKNVIDKLDFDGVSGFANWSKHGIIDLHAGLLYALAAYKLCQFNDCTNIITTLISSIDNNCKQFYSESEYLADSVSKFTSHSTNSTFLQRSLCTPFRLNLKQLVVSNTPTQCNVYTMISSWLNILFMANTCNSEISPKTFERIEIVLRNLENTKFFLIGYIMRICAQYLPNCFPTICRDQQLKAFSFGIQVNKCYYANYLQMGHIYREMESFKESLTFYTEAYRLMPSSPICAYYYAVALCKQEEWEKALDVYSSVDRSDFTKDMWLNYGLINLRLGRINDCLPALQRVVLAKNDALSWEILGEAYLLRRSHETAVKAFNRALDLDPNQPFTLILCGRAHRHMNDSYSSLGCFNKALKMIENNYMTDPLYRKFYVLIIKELIEIHMNKCQSGMYQGYTGQALNDLQYTLSLLNKLLNYFINSKVVPFWFFRYTGDILSLLSVIDDRDLLIEIPSRLVSLMKGSEYLLGDSKVSDDAIIKVNIVTCLHLASIYLACALRTSISSVRYPAQSLDPSQLCHNATITNNNDNTTELSATSTTDPLKILIISSILVSLGISQLNQGYFIQRNHIPQDELTATDTKKSLNLTPKELYHLSECTLKQALQLLDNLSNIYEEFLNELLKAKSLLDPGVTTSDDEIDEHDTRDRINLIKKLKSRAWASLAGVYSTSHENLDSEITYCLCQALLLNPDNTTVMVNLAMQQMKQGQTEVIS
ncbi:Tetratricopeptide repeat protein [Schistosoma japonicum]|uniref:Tetratricopeptide repeat protein n=2 Tax=Schistosoma japonicum TaxID=6182 RepID=A0A4Z2DLN9_SCHJA|nr:Tetratricopeptide repeat protein [Schistosoma japonicum]